MFWVQKNGQGRCLHFFRNFYFLYLISLVFVPIFSRFFGADQVKRFFLFLSVGLVQCRSVTKAGHWQVENFPNTDDLHRQELENPLQSTFQTFQRHCQMSNLTQSPCFLVGLEHHTLSYIHKFSEIAKWMSRLQRSAPSLARLGTRPVHWLQLWHHTPECWARSRKSRRSRVACVAARRTRLRPRLN